MKDTTLKKPSPQREDYLMFSLPDRLPPLSSIFPISKNISSLGFITNVKWILCDIIHKTIAKNL